MRSRAPLFVLMFVVGLFALPLAAQASIPFFGPIVPPNINLCAAGWGSIIDVINRMIELFITLAIVFVAPLTIAYAGFLLVVNQGDPGKVTEAKRVLTNTVVGIIIALCGWLIVDAIMAVLYTSPTGSSWGTTWSQLVSSGGEPFCLVQEGSLYKLNQTTYQGISATGIVTTPGGNISANILSATNLYTGASTSSGPGGGAQACAWAVNNVLASAGVDPIGSNSVAGMENALKNGRGTLIDQSVAMPGDIVIENAGGHVGVCLNEGCSQVISNSSSKATFSWVSGPNFLPSYGNGPSRIYRVTS